MYFRKTRQKRTGINLDMTPMIDCVFNLLIFFALSFNFGVAPGIKVKLPEASAKALKKEKKEIIVSISREGNLSVEGKRVTIDELAAKFKELFNANPDASVIIQGDEEAHHGRIVQVMDRAKLAGLNKLAIATRPAER